MTIHLGVSIETQEMKDRNEHTSRKPGIACRPPIRPKSIPYWNGDMEINVHATIHFQFSRRPLPVDASGMMKSAFVYENQSKTFNEWYRIKSTLRDEMESERHLEISPRTCTHSPSMGKCSKPARPPGHLGELDTIASEFRLLSIPINLSCMNPLNSPSLPQTMHG